MATKPTPPTAPQPPSIPSLDECIKSIKTLGRKVLSTREQATLLTNLLGYCIHIARDQDTLAGILRSGKDFPAGLPFSKLPAITQLVVDPSLFQSFISLLTGTKSDGLSGSQNGSHVMPPVGSSYQPKNGRKRSPSEDVTPNGGRKKSLMLSPTPGSRIHPKAAHANAATDIDGSSGQLSEKSIPVFSATILYSVFQHADHWPDPIMKAFAEDSFGHRSWVDDERCKAFVSNLEISIKPKEVNGVDRASASVAEEIETYFSFLMVAKPVISSVSEVLNGASASSLKLKELSSKEKRKQSKYPKSSDESSSSGEEEVLESESLPTKNTDESSSLSPVPSSAAASALRILFNLGSISKKRIRPRYHMHCLEVAYEIISDAFQERLNSKSKQNSRLLQVLPSFLSIPRVRCLASRHLERWLQSPALAGLARTLLARMVQELCCVEPPLPDDLEVINNVLALNLKANQLSMHIDHVTMIAKKMHTRYVAKLIFIHCLKGECAIGSISNALKPSDEHLRMLRSVYAVLDRKLAAKALASSVSLLTSDMLNSASKSDLFAQFQNIRCLLESVVDILGAQLFDGFQFVKAIIKAHSGTSNNIASANSTARLIFECTLLVTRTVPSLQAVLEAAAPRSGNTKSSMNDFDSVNDGEMQGFRRSMVGLRKSILTWCLTDLCRLYHKKVSQEEQARCSDTYYERGAVTRGPGAPDYSSVLSEAKTSQGEDDRSSSFHKMMTFIRCVLFLSLPSSKELETFASTGEDNMQSGRYCRIDFCCCFGINIDDEMLRIVLSSNSLTSGTALSIIENLILRCGGSSTAEIRCNAKTVWDMYRLAEYSPEFRSDAFGRNGSVSSSDDDSESFVDDEQYGRKRRKLDGDQSCHAMSFDKSKLPRLAVTSLWWRVSSVVLILCGVQPEIGAAMWNEAPTLRALIKMTTSQKYRFPTNDCSETEKERIRKVEEKVREEEAKIAEALFIPPQKKKVAKPKPQILSPAQQRRGLRSSARQRVHKEQILAIEQERQEAAEHADNVKLKKILRILQKNLMIFDPKQEQRKPPKGSINLLLSLNSRFGLAEKFRLSTAPDFLLRTIGEGRSAIERAYDWLIPIISAHPATIDRLQPSASCFLLLRAYGEEGDNDSELLNLTAPLLAHVSGAVKGELGEQQALLAMELLLQDISDESFDRRKCSRKVLQQAIGNADVVESSYFPRDLGNCGWLLEIMNVQNSNELVPLVIQFISQALAFERGKVLSNYVLALYEYNAFLKKHDILDDFDFASTLCELIALRSHVCSEVFDRFPPLRLLAVSQVRKAFAQAIASDSAHHPIVAALTNFVTLTITKEVSESVENDGDAISVVISSNLLHASIILISNWQKRSGEESEQQNNEEEKSIVHLLRYLVIPFKPTNEAAGLGGNSTSGLSSAKHKLSGKSAVSVAEWVLLAKAREEKVAKQAALSTPDIFLPRLLLCCGLPKLSFSTFLQRLDQLGESSSDSGKTFEELISTSAVSEWGLPGIGKRSVIKRKLHGRILAYRRIHGEQPQELSSKETSAFISWLAPQHNTSIKKRDTSTDIAGDAEALASDPLSLNNFEDLMEEDSELGMSSLLWLQNESKNDGQPVLNESISRDFIHSCVSNDQYDMLEQSIDSIVTKSMNDNDIEGSVAAANTLLESFNSLQGNNNILRIFFKWVPILLQSSGNERLWRLIFIEDIGQTTNQCYLMSLVFECALKWSDEHVGACQSWISQQVETKPWKTIHSLQLVLRFLVVSMEQRSIHCFQYEEDARVSTTYTQSDEFVTSIAKLVLDFILMNGSIAQNGVKCNTIAARNNLPDWLTLIMLVGRSNLSLTVKLILEKMDVTNTTSSLSSIILRLYVMSPRKMNLRDSKLRNVLLQASSDHLPSWLSWRCPLDNQLSAMLINLTKSPHQRLVQSVTDQAKQHPLIFARHLNTINQNLLQDGSGRDSENQNLMKRGRIFGVHPAGNALAQIGDHAVKVTIVLWGYSFNESIWTCIIDVLMALPAEVTFGCGTKAGLLDILETYLTLFAVQMVDLNAECNVVRLRDKFAVLIESFRKCKPTAFESWVQTNTLSWGTIQQLLHISHIGI